MGSTATRLAGWDVLNDTIGGRRCFGGNNWRAVIPSTEIDAYRSKLCSEICRYLRADFLPLHRTGGQILFHAGWNIKDTHLPGYGSRSTRVAYGNRSALDLIRSEQRLAAPTLQNSRELP